MRLLEGAWALARSAWDKVAGWWQRATPGQKSGIALGAGLLCGSIIVGGRVLMYAAGGLLVNVMGWAIIRDSKPVMKFMAERGWWVDFILTLGSFFGSGGALGTWLMMLMATSFFTVFRKVYAVEEAK